MYRSSHHSTVSSGMHSLLSRVLLYLNKRPPINVHIKQYTILIHHQTEVLQRHLYLFTSFGAIRYDVVYASALDNNTQHRRGRFGGQAARIRKTYAHRPKRRERKATRCGGYISYGGAMCGTTQHF